MLRSFVSLVPVVVLRFVSPRDLKSLPESQDVSVLRVTLSLEFTCRQTVLNENDMSVRNLQKFIKRRKYGRFKPIFIVT